MSEDDQDAELIVLPARVATTPFEALQEQVRQQSIVIDVLCERVQKLEASARRLPD